MADAATEAAAQEAATAETETKLTWEQQQAAGPEEPRTPENVEKPYEVLFKGEYTKGIEHIPGMTVMLRDDVALQYIRSREIQEETRPEKLWVKCNTKLTGRKLAARLDKLAEASGTVFPPKVAVDPEDEDDEE